MELYYVGYTIDKLNVSTEHWWHGTDRGRVKNFEKKPNALPFCSLQIPHGLLLGQTLASTVRSQHLIVFRYPRAATLL